MVIREPQIYSRTAENVAAESQGEPIERRVFVGAILVLLVGSVGLNVLLARRIRNFTYARQAAIDDRIVKVGTAVPPIAAKRLNGQQEMISYQTTNYPTVLYIFTPPCSWCARNVDNFKTLANKESERYRFIGLSLSKKGLTEYVAKNELKLPVYSSLSPETLTTYKLGSTPQTIVISPEGKVLQDWVGAYVGKQQKEIESFFHVTLPGLRDLPKVASATN